MQSVLPYLPVGWRFQPTNEELLDHYLKKKRLGHPILGSDIEDIQTCDFDAGELLDEKSGDKQRYLFYRRQFRLKPGGTQRKRKAKAGFWKRAGEIQFITLEDSDEVIGTKKIFVYHDPKPTEYVKHEFEYTAQLDSPVQDDHDFVIVKLIINKKKKANKTTKKVERVSKKKESKKTKNIEVDYKKSTPNKKARKGLSFCETPPVSVSDHQKQKKIMAYSARGEGELINHMISNFEDQSPYSMAANSTWEKGESSHQGASYFEYKNTYEMSDISTHNKADTSFPVTSDLNNQIPREISIVSRNGIAESSGLVTANSENKNPNVMTDMSSSNPGCLSSSWVESQNPYERTTVSTNKKGETSYHTNFGFENRNQNEMNSDKGKLSYLPVTSDFGNQNASVNADISTSVEGKWSPLRDMPSDFRKQNGNEKPDMSNSECRWSALFSSGVQETAFQVESRYKEINIPDLDDIRLAAFPEIDSELLDELTEMDDLLDTLCSEPTDPPPTN